jgi:hypothetical protein
MTSPPVEVEIRCPKMLGTVSCALVGVAFVTAVLVSPTPALATGRGQIPSRLAGTWAAQLPNYPHIGLYAGQYKLTFGPGLTVRYSVPGEGNIPQGVTVSGNRITFLLSGQCITRGTYIWTVKGKTLTFTKLTDACRVRALTLGRRWRRIG